MVLAQIAAIPLRQQITAAVASVILLVIIIDLVRRRRLREDYAWLWFCMTVVVLVLSIQLSWLNGLTHFLGAKVPASGAYFLGLVFLMLINLHFSIKSSELSSRLKTLAQRTALLEAEVHRLYQQQAESAADRPDADL